MTQPPLAALSGPRISAGIIVAAILALPLYACCSIGLDYLFGQGRWLHAYQYESRRALLREFIQGWLQLWLIALLISSAGAAILLACRAWMPQPRLTSILIVSALSGLIGFWFFSNNFLASINFALSALALQCVIALLCLR